MPIYAYRCDACGHEKDVLQKLSDPPLRTCPACGQDAMVKKITAPAFQLKGTGWYVTDFRDKGKGAGGAEAAKSGAEGDARSGGDADGKTGAEPGGGAKAEPAGDAPAPKPSAGGDKGAAKSGDGGTPAPSPAPGGGNKKVA